MFGFVKEMVSLYTKINSFIKGNPPPHKNGKDNDTVESEFSQSQQHSEPENSSRNENHELEGRNKNKKATGLSASEIPLHIDENEEHSGRKVYLERYLNQPDEFQEAVVQEALKRSKLKIANKKN